jgi:hypothetical protein
MPSPSALTLSGLPPSRDGHASSTESADLTCAEGFDRAEQRLSVGATARDPGERLTAPRSAAAFAWRLIRCGPTARSLPAVEPGAARAC